MRGPGIEGPAPMPAGVFSSVSLSWVGLPGAGSQTGAEGLPVFRTVSSGESG